MQKRVVILSDTQAPYHLPQAIALAVAFIQDYKPDTVIFNGDIVDFITMSKFLRVGGSKGPHRVIDEIKITEEEVIKPIIKACPKAEKIWVEGNHEFRLLRYIAACAPALEGAIDIEDILGCKRHNIKYIHSKAGNGIFRLTPLLTIMHGVRTGLNPAKLQYDDWGGSLVMGHSHKEATWRKKHGCGRDEIAIASGCMCKDPDWRDSDNYTRGFIVGWYDDETGEFGLDHARISGDNYTDMYTPWGNYYALYKNGVYIGKRRGSLNKGRKGPDGR